MTAFVLVHSPLVGPLTWAPVAAMLRERGHGAVVPQLRNDRSPHWERHAEGVSGAVSGFAPGEPLVFVGHSASGAFLPMAAERSGRAVSGYVFVDAGLPGVALRTAEEMAALRASADAGGRIPAWGSDLAESLWGLLIPDGGRRRAFRAELEPIPVGLFEEEIALPGAWLDAACAYLRFSAFYKAVAEEARRRGWPVEEIEGQHLHMLVEPDRVAEALVRLASQPSTSEGANRRIREWS